MQQVDSNASMGSTYMHLCIIDEWNSTDYRYMYMSMNTGGSQLITNQ